LLVERPYEAAMRGIRAVVPGRALNVIGRVIESYARRFGYGVVRDSPDMASELRSTPA
jgi:methionyl aminopeptidase